MKLVIFDLDGTLLDTLQDIANSCNYALNKHGFPIHPKSAYKRFVGNGIHTLIERALPVADRTDDIIEKVKADFVAYYDMHGQDSTQPYPGIMNMLRHLKEMGLLISVASNKYHEAVVPLVQHYFPDILFDLVLGHRTGRPAKPNPDIIFDTLHTLGIAPQNCCYVGDSDVDMITAKQADIKAIGVAWGFRNEAELIKHGANNIIQAPSHLFDIVLD